MTNYYIYHVAGIKVGCTKNLKRRVEKEQGYLDYEVLEVYTDKAIASKREKELQLEFGYRVDGGEYSQMEAMGRISSVKNLNNKVGIHNPERRKEYASLGGKAQGPITGAKNRESGHIQKLGRQLAEYNNRLQSCPYCEVESRGIGYIRWHGENCKHKNK